MKNNRKDTIKIASFLGSFCSNNGATLIFTTQKKYVESIVSSLIKLRQKTGFESTKLGSSEQEELINSCKTILPEEHLLIKSLKYGIAYHHGELPDKIKKEIEKALRKNIISLVVSTTTLAQGVNLPLKSIIIHSLKWGDKYMPSSQYLNIIGRAGRAGKETEGHIIFCDERDWDYMKNQSEDSKSFIISSLESLLQTRFPSIQKQESFLEQFTLASTSQYYRKEYIPQKLSHTKFSEILNDIQDEGKKNFLTNSYYKKHKSRDYYFKNNLPDGNKKKCRKNSI